ncbi:MAG: S8 family serine peptidase [Pseudomonadota bacterium]
MTSTSTIKPVEKPVQFDSPMFEIGIELVEVDNLIHATEARNKFGVSGKGLCVAVCDTGINAEHVDFQGRIVDQVNFTVDNGGELGDANDGHGHGTNVGGIIVANHDHIGIAPGSSIVPIKVLDNNGDGNFQDIKKGLEWVLENHQQHAISVVCMSLGGSQNFQSDISMSNDEIKLLIKELEHLNIAVVIAAGNDFYMHHSQEGMSYPAIIKESISVGAVYDKNVGSFSYKSGAIAHTTAADRITPFSQRLHTSTHPKCFTDVFAPGAPVTSSGINGKHGESIQHGTSQAAPVVCGVILLAQELYHKASGELPEVTKIKHWIQTSSFSINDGDDEHDNVANTNKNYIRIDAMRLLGKVRRSLEVASLVHANILEESPQ